MVHQTRAVFTAFTAALFLMSHFASAKECVDAERGSDLACRSEADDQDDTAMLQLRVKHQAKSDKLTEEDTMPAENDADDFRWDTDTEETEEHLEEEAEEIEDAGLIDTSQTTTTMTTTPMMDLRQEHNVSDVVCGGHRAETCAECPRGHGRSWCNGECVWQNNACVAPAVSPPYGCPSPVNGVWPGGNCKKRTLSIHLNFKRPTAARSPSWYYQEMVATDVSSATYFATNTHGYGYAGLQVAHKNKGNNMGDRVICSTWDQDSANARITECGEGVKCVGFGGEGTGAKALWYYKWTVGKRYAFMLNRKKLSNGLIEHKCWFYADELKASTGSGWKHIATATSGANYYGDTFRDSGAFVEQWTHEDTHELRKADFGPTYYKNSNGEWAQSVQARFGPNCHKERERNGLVDCDHKSAGASSDGGRVFMRTGGLEEINVNSITVRSQQRRELPSALLEFPAMDGPTTTPKPVARVSCGNHKAETCAECPQGHGRGWCHGDCEWRDNSCKVAAAPGPKPKPSKRVSCGNHKAATCAECPQGNGKSWCNGQCEWRNNACQSPA